MRKGNLFMKKATKWAMSIIAFAILILVVIWGSMKMVQLEEEQEQAMQKIEEEQKAKEQKERKVKNFPGLRVDPEAQ